MMPEGLGGLTHFTQENWSIGSRPDTNGAGAV